MMKEKIKGLFITHVPLMHLYGAGTSLRLYLKNNQEIEAYIIIQRPINPLKWWKKEVLEKEKEYFQGKVKKIYRFFLPIDFCYEGSPERLVDLIYAFLKNILFHLFKWQINRLCFQEKYDFIYLNSVALNSLINKKYNYLLHVREILYCSNRKTLSRIRQCKGLIFIDPKTQQVFSDKNLIGEDCKVLNLNNPVDMTPLKEINIEEFQDFLKNYKLIKYYYNNYKIFSCIGTIIPVKGVDFIINSFLEAKLENSILLVVGNESDKKYSQKCRKLSLGQEIVCFLGEINDINKIYYLSDFILRGDPDFRIGRTIFEGLYSGCGIILPGSQEDIDGYQEFSPFKEKIYPYKPRDINDMVRVLKICNNINVWPKEYKSNAKEYAKKMNEFICNHIVNKKF